MVQGKEEWRGAKHEQGIAVALMPAPSKQRIRETKGVRRYGRGLEGMKPVRRVKKAAGDRSCGGGSACALWGCAPGCTYARVSGQDMAQTCLYFDSKKHLSAALGAHGRVMEESLHVLVRTAQCCQ